MFGRGDGVAARRVHHDDAALGRRRGVHVVQAGPGPADDPQLAGRGDHVGRHLGRAADDQPLVVLDLAEQLLLRHLGLDIDGQTGLLENLDPLLGEHVGDQDFHLASSSSSAFPTPDPSRIAWARRAWRAKTWPRPSALSIFSTSWSPRISDTAAVYAVWFFCWASRSFLKLK